MSMTPSALHCHRSLRRAVATILLIVASCPAFGEEPAPVADADATKYPDLRAFEATVPTWFPKLLGAQWTFVNQNQFPFDSPYSGLNSLNEHGEDKTSETRSVHFGSRVTENFHLYLDMEWALGRGLHGGNGAGGYVNGEVIRAGSADVKKTPYLARAYGRYVFPLSPERAPIERGIGQVPGEGPVEYLIAKAGKMATGDDFDVNRYANSARTQFLNFALINNGAYDYAADTRGFTQGVMLGIVQADWSLKFGSYMVPEVANGARFDTQIHNARGDNLELSVKPLANDTVIRFLAYMNHGRMGRYSDAIAQARASGTTPDIRADAQAGRVKYGFGLNAEVPLADEGDTGLFFRAAWNDGRTETFMFTEIDRDVSGGIQISGANWGRDTDWIGIGASVNFLSNAHKNYVAAGGNGFMIGDGRINYSPEQIVETYYSFELVDQVRLGPDYQFIRNPGYNADRGPVHILGFRLRASM
jgi:hypothetical protein